MKNKVIAPYFLFLLDLTPYPKTRKEHQEYRASGEYEWGKYEPPYRLLYFDPFIGCHRYFKKGNSLSLCYIYLIYNRYGIVNIARDSTPWLGLNFNIRI